MGKANQIPLFDSRSAQYIIGCIMRNPTIIYDENKYILTMDDFDNKLYSIIFGAVYNLTFNGAEKITPINLDIFLTSNSNNYEYYQNSNGRELVELLYESTDEFSMAQFDFHYERVKKFTTLRELRKKGFDITEFYNPTFLNQEEEEEKLNKLTVIDILNKIRGKIQIIENDNVRKQEASGQYAVSGIRELVKSLKEIPEVGIPLEGKYMNYATRGCRKGKMFLYSAPSGGGKTRTMLGNACSIAYPKIENGKLIRRQVLEPVLFIATEMQADEIQTLILSWISGVDEEKILLGTYTEDEEKLLNIAINIMEAEEFKNNFIIESIPNPSIQHLKSLITNYILQDGIQYVFYDYIFSSAGLMEEYRGINLREDVLLMMLSNTLKEIAASYNVFVMTGTQLNGTWEGKTVRNANMLRGSKAIADKIDVGMIGVRAPDEELDTIKTYCEEMKLPCPNIVIDIYKNRRGKMCDVKIFRKFDYGTCRTKDILVTTQGYKIINEIPNLIFEVNEQDLSEYE